MVGTVAQLRKIIEGAPDEAPVLINLRDQEGRAPLLKLGDGEVLSGPEWTDDISGMFVLLMVELRIDIVPKEQA